MLVQAIYLFSCATWVATNLFLLLGIAGLCFGSEGDRGTRVWGTLGFLALFFGANAWALHLLERYLSV